jgi:hypothetical protein
MSAQFSFRRRLALVLIPTPSQALACFILAIVLLIGPHVAQILSLIGLSDSALSILKLSVRGWLESVLTMPISQTVAFMTFWLGVGLITYLVCWLGLILLSQARNELTLTTNYTNRGHWQGPYETLALKCVGAAVLVTCVAILKPGLVLWLGVVGTYFSGPNLSGGLFALFATLGFAVQLYLILAFALVTFTPWYRAEAFTDSEI